MSIPSFLFIKVIGSRSFARHQTTRSTLLQRLLVDDPSEFGLSMMVMGLAPFSALEKPKFAQIVERGQSSAIQRKVREISQESDPAIANDRRIALSE